MFVCYVAVTALSECFCQNAEIRSSVSFLRRTHDQKPRCVFVTKPQRDAIIELAKSYSSFLYRGGSSFEIAANAKRLNAAQEVFGVELYPRHMLEALELRKDAA